MRLFKSSILFSSAAATILSLSACGPQSSSSQAQPSAVSGKADIGGPFSLVNQDGQSVNESSYLGKPQLIYFGFAYCPDICPTSLQKMGTALSLMGGQADDVQPMFFTIDPERDTPASLKLYLTARGFPKNMVALTGTQEQVDAAIKAYRIYARRAVDDASSAGYTMDHASLFYLMDEKGEFVDVMGHDTTAQGMAERLKLYLKTAD